MNLHEPFSHHRRLAGAMHSGITGSVLSATAIAVSLASTGITMYSQQQQASNAERIASYNAAIERQNAEINARVAIQQSQWQQQSAHAQYQAQQNNAIELDNRARAVEAQGREQARRTREENERALARQRGQFAKSGVVNEGTPLAVMAESAGHLELAVQDSAYQTDMESRAIGRKAELERYQSGFSLFDESVAKYQEAATRGGHTIAYNQAALNKSSAYSQAQGIRMQSYGTLLSGISSVAQQGASAWSKIPQSPTTYTSGPGPMKSYVEVRRAQRA